MASGTIIETINTRIDELNTESLAFRAFHCGHACIFSIHTKKGIKFATGTMDE